MLVLSPEVEHKQWHEPVRAHPYKQGGEPPNRGAEAPPPSTDRRIRRIVTILEYVVNRTLIEGSGAVPEKVRGLLEEELEGKVDNLCLPAYVSNVKDDYTCTATYACIYKRMYGTFCTVPLQVCTVPFMSFNIV